VLISRSFFARAAAEVLRFGTDFFLQSASASEDALEAMLEVWRVEGCSSTEAAFEEVGRSDS